MSRLAFQARYVLPLLRTSLQRTLQNGLPTKSLALRHLTVCACCGTGENKVNKNTGYLHVSTRRASLSANGKSEFTNVKPKSLPVLEKPDFRRNVLAFAQELGVNIPDITDLLSFIIHESYLLTNAKNLTETYQSNEKLAFIGAQTMRKVVAEYLHMKFPELTARESWDVQNGLLEEYVFQRAEEWNIIRFTLYSRQSKDLMAQQAVLAMIGAVYTFESPNRASEFVESQLIPDLRPDDISALIKLQHPKYILRELVTNAGKFPLRTRLDYTKKSKSHLHLDNAEIFCVSVLQGEDKERLAQEVKHLLPLAEKKACQQALRVYYPEEFLNFQFSMKADNFVTEAELDLGLVMSEQRVVEIEKGEEGFGFFIKGGEKKKGTNEQWLVYHYTTPIFISHIVPGGVADRNGGLSVGDKILAVNDRSVEGLDHGRATSLLNSVNGHVTLTVSYAKEVLIADQVEMKYKDMKRRKRMAELASDVWSEWHQAQANRRPSQYKDVLKYRKPSQDTHNPTT